MVEKEDNSIGDKKVGQQVAGNQNIITGTGDVKINVNSSPAMLPKSIHFLLYIPIIFLLIIAISVFMIVGKMDKYQQIKVEPEPSPFITQNDEAIKLKEQDFDLIPKEPSGFNYYTLTNDQKRKEISKALQNNNVLEAISILDSIDDNAMKDEECERIYRFCIKNDNLNAAIKIVNLNAAIKIVNDCWGGARKKEALEKINNEILKLKEK